jgi:outer membrane protein assembly factor BamA
VSLPLLGEFDSQAISLSYSMMQFASDLPMPGSADPASLVTVLPPRGFFADMHLGYAYSNAETNNYAVGAEKGFSVSLGSDLGAHELGSESTLQSFTAQVVGYVPLPWLAHHVLALSAAAGTSAGTYSKRGIFYTGGFFESSLVDAFRYGAMQGGFVLRGYRPAQFIGSQYNLFNAEYRFPLFYPDRGESTLPVFLRTVSGAVFADLGGAFQALNRSDPWDSYHLGVGAELWLDLVVGYEVGATLRLGHGQGTDSKAPPGGQTYLVAAATF